jgi:hypothetical protein
MKVKIKRNKPTDPKSTFHPSVATGVCEIEKEPGEQNIKEYKGWCPPVGLPIDPNSTFFYHVKRVLLQQGYDVIKKQMCKDGHLTDTGRQYIRSRKLKGEAFVVFDHRWPMNELAVNEYNKTGKTWLTMHFIYEPSKGG